jgi:hypothetical protein
MHRWRGVSSRHSATATPTASLAQATLEQPAERIHRELERTHPDLPGDSDAAPYALLQNLYAFMQHLRPPQHGPASFRHNHVRNQLRSRQQPVASGRCDLDRAGKTHVPQTALFLASLNRSIRCMLGAPIGTDRSPFSARLLLRVALMPAGGPVMFQRTVRQDGNLSSADFASWLPATSITRPGWVRHGAESVARIAAGAGGLVDGHAARVSADLFGGQAPMFNTSDLPFVMVTSGPTRSSRRRRASGERTATVLLEARGTESSTVVSARSRRGL